MNCQRELTTHGERFIWDSTHACHIFTRRFHQCVSASTMNVLTINIAINIIIIGYYLYLVAALLTPPISRSVLFETVYKTPFFAAASTKAATRKGDDIRRSRRELDQHEEMSVRKCEENRLIPVGTINRTV